MPLILRYGEEADGFLIFLLIYEEPVSFRFIPFLFVFTERWRAFIVL